MEEFYNKHYITVDEQNRIIDGFSNAFREPTEDDICINEQGGYQFRMSYLVYDPTYELSWHHRVSEENPSLFDWDSMIPLYKYEGGYVKRRTEEEIEADRKIINTLTPSQQREQAYNTETIISWSGDMITVTQAAQLWQYYAAEGNEKATELQALIAEAKGTIREKYPD